MKGDAYCPPPRVLAQTAKTRGGTLGPPAYRKENFAVPEKNLEFGEHGSQRIAESSLGVEQASEGFWERVVHHEVLNSTFSGKIRLCVSFLDQFKSIF